MNEEGEYVRKTQCPFCKYKNDSPKCMWQEKGKCSQFHGSGNSEVKNGK